MNGHRGPVSALSMEHDEKGYFSAGWDGEALVSCRLLLALPNFLYDPFVMTIFCSNGTSTLVKLFENSLHMALNLLALPSSQ